MGDVGLTALARLAFVGFFCHPVGAHDESPIRFGMVFAQSALKSFESVVYGGFGKDAGETCTPVSREGNLKLAHTTASQLSGTSV